MCCAYSPERQDVPALEEVRGSEAFSTPAPLVPLDETSFEAGIKVQIHSQDEPPFIDQLGFGVAPGFQTFVACQEQRVRGHRRMGLGWGVQDGAGGPSLTGGADEQEPG